MGKVDLKKIIKLECAMAVFIILLFCIFDFYLQGKKIIQFRKEIRESKVAKEELSASEKEEREIKFKKRVSEIRDFLKLIPQATREVQDKVIQEKNIPLVTMEIEDLAAASGIKLVAVKPSDIQEKDEYEILPIEVEFKCKYTELIHFLARIENSSKLIATQKMSIKRDDFIYPQLNIKLTVVALFATKGNSKKEEVEKEI